MNVRVITLILLLVPWTFSFIHSTRSVCSITVKEGDWIKYEYQTATRKPYLFPLYSYQLVELLGVSGSNVTMRLTGYFPAWESAFNPPNDTMTIDLESFKRVDIGLLDARVFVIPADPGLSDTIYLGAFGNRTFQGETTKMHAGERRTILFMSFSWLGGNWWSFCWDKQTGVLVEWSFAISEIDALNTFEATKTNIWGEVEKPPSDSPWPWIAATAGGTATTAAVAILLNKRRSKARSASENTSLRPSLKSCN